MVGGNKCQAGLFCSNGIGRSRHTELIKGTKKGNNFHELELSPIEVTHIVKCVENDHHRQSADINQKRLLPPPPLLSVIMN